MIEAPTIGAERSIVVCGDVKIETPRTKAARWSIKCRRCGELNDVGNHFCDHCWILLEVDD